MSSIGVKRTLSKAMACVLLFATVLSFSGCGKTVTDGGSGAQTSETQSSGKKTDIVSKRTISVEELNGTVNSFDGSATVTLVKGENLQSGRTVNTESDSDLTLLLDSDKHVYAGEETKFELVAEGGEKSTKTRFKLERGILKSVIDNPLGSDESYEVETPNGTMAVRGTTFTVRVAEEEGAFVTIVDVEEGKVSIETADGKSEEVNPGEIKEITDSGVKDTDLSGRFRLHGVRMNDYLMNYSTYEEYAYDEAGLRGASYFIDGDLKSFYDYAYGENGKPFEKVIHAVGGAMMYKEEYEYDAAGNMIKLTKVMEDGTIEEEDFFTYDSNGNLIEKSYPQYAPGGWTGKIVYSYDSSGKILSEDKYEKGEPLSQTTYEYDDNGRLSEYKVHNLESADDEFYDVIQNDYKYDAWGRIVEYTLYQGYESISATHPEAEVYICRTNYDIYGNKTKVTFTYTSYDDSISNTYEYTYEEEK
ncbi:MAG: FecR family protein [Lachnospiraceae bacterium]|nr:FecR family protein [Lachnospiraceae bacterium]